MSKKKIYRILAYALSALWLSYCVAGIISNYNNYSLLSWIIIIAFIAFIAFPFAVFACLKKWHTAKTPATEVRSQLDPRIAVHPAPPVPSAEYALSAEPSPEAGERTASTLANEISPKPLSYEDAEALLFWSHKRTDYVIPAYYSENSFGRNVGPALHRLLESGYLEKSSVEDSIRLKTIPELKAILSDRELKQTGKKGELIDRIIKNFDFFELETLFPVRVYEIKEQGHEAISAYTIVFESEKLSLGFPFYRLMSEKGKTPHDSDDEILTRLFSQDMQDAYRRKDKDAFTSISQRAGIFLEAIGEFEPAFDCYALSFFVQSRVSHDAGGYVMHLAMNIDRCGKRCGYSLTQTLIQMEAGIRKSNPFALATHYSINETTTLFKRCISLAQHKF